MMTDDSISDDRRSPASEYEQRVQRADINREVNRQRAWHVDKTIPLVLIFGIFIQTAGAFWWASSVSEVNREQDAKIMDLTHTLSTLAVNIEERNERLAKLETIGQVVNDKVDRVNDKVDRIVTAIASDENSSRSKKMYPYPN